MVYMNSKVQRKVLKEVQSKLPSIKSIQIFSKKIAPLKYRVVFKCKWKNEQIIVIRNQTSVRNAINSFISEVKEKTNKRNLSNIRRLSLKEVMMFNNQL